MLFLDSRKSDPEVGTLLVALENGVIQVWNHHVAGGFITSFSAIHKAGDYVISMTSDLNNEFLFTGNIIFLNYYYDLSDHTDNTKISHNYNIIIIACL